MLLGIVSVGKGRRRSGGCGRLRHCLVGLLSLVVGFLDAVNAILVNMVYVFNCFGLSKRTVGVRVLFGTRISTIRSRSGGCWHQPHHLLGLSVIPLPLGEPLPSQWPSGRHRHASDFRRATRLGQHRGTAVSLDGRRAPPAPTSSWPSVGPACRWRRRCRGASLQDPKHLLLSRYDL